MPVAVLVAGPVVDRHALGIAVQTLLRARRLRHDAEQRAAVAVGVHQQLHEARYAQHNTSVDSRLRPRADAAPWCVTVRTPSPT